MLISWWLVLETQQQCLQWVVVSSRSASRARWDLKNIKKKSASKVDNSGQVSIVKSRSQISHFGSVSISHPLNLPCPSCIAAGGRAVRSSPSLNSIFQEPAELQNGLALPYSSAHNNFRLEQELHRLSKQNISRSAPPGAARSWEHGRGEAGRWAPRGRRVRRGSASAETPGASFGGWQPGSEF